MKNLSERQNEIINNSIKLIGEGGIQNLTIKNLSEKLGISEPAIYRHFKSKFDILDAILDRFDHHQEALGISNSDLSAIKKLESMFLTRCKKFSQNPHVTRVIFSEEIFQSEKALSDKIFSIISKTQNEITQTILVAQTKGEITDNIPAEHISHIFLGTLRLLVTRWRLSNFSFNLIEESENYWKTLEKIFLTGI